VVGVNGAEWGQSIANDSEQGDEDVVDYIYYVGLFGAEGYPADEEEDPSCAKEGD
jgi:hypothetical protein